MSMMKALGFVAIGTIGILAMSMFISKIMNAGFEWFFGTLLVVVVVGGLILKFR